MVMPFIHVLNRASVAAFVARLSISPTTLAVASMSAFSSAPKPLFASTVSLTCLPSVAMTTRRSFARSTTHLFSSPSKRYLLSYEYIPDVLEKRGPYREGHLGLAKDMIEEGVCVSGGPTSILGESVPNGGM